LDTGFAQSNSLIENKKAELEGVMKALSQEKDEALLRIDSCFEDYSHTLSRRTTLLKNKVIAIYNAHVEALESDMEEVSTAITCIVSLKEFYETFLARGQLAEIEQGLLEMEEVQQNIREKVVPKENHIIFENKHGADKFKGCVKDLGRVRCSRPTQPRTEPEGNDANLSSTAADSTLTPISPPDPPFTSESIRVGAAAPHEATRPRDPMTTSFHAQIASPFEPPRNTADCATDATVAHVVASAGAACGNRVNSNQEKPVMVVRPKTLQSVKPKSVTKHSPVKSKPAAVAGNPKQEILKQTDKMYHHLVYTSYDEEELLKELQAGKVQVDETARAARSGRRMEDSWTTVSSDGDSTLSGNSDDVESPRDVSQL
jgi:hypothetical protein